jgi:2-polyprenyl-6-methoxyphenol hydroxylase-like FAD-dependent oxidoreductase
VALAVPVAGEANYHYSCLVAETHAVVIGASVAGLLAASALAESFSRVTVYDADALPDEARSRPGVPQGRQAHVLQARGSSALDELLPGLVAELVAAGAAPADQQLDVHWYLDDHLLFPAASGLTGIAVTRPLLERMVRDRVAKVPGVQIVDSTVVDGIILDRDSAPGARVAGVRVRGRDAGGDPAGGDAAETVAASLVVDASGRGSRTPAWLRELGYGEVPVTKLRTDVVYVTRHYSATPDQLNGLVAAVYTPYPGKHRGGALIRQEGDQWVVLIAGMLGEDPPASDEGFAEYAESFAGHEMATVVKTSQPLDSPAKMRFPGSIRRHYDKLGQLPEGLVVTGDALCTFNPIYGQGMTVAALEALALHSALRSSALRSSALRSRALIGSAIRDEGLAGLSARFAAAAARIVDEAWALSAGGDLRFPQVTGKRQLSGRIVNAYLDRFRPAASGDPVLARAFVRVANMIDPPARLLTPANVVRVLRAPRKSAAIRRRRDRYASVDIRSR